MSPVYCVVGEPSMVARISAKSGWRSPSKSAMANCVEPKAAAVRTRREIDCPQFEIPDALPIGRRPGRASRRQEDTVAYRRCAGSLRRFRQPHYTTGLAIHGLVRATSYLRGAEMVKHIRQSVNRIASSADRNTITHPRHPPRAPNPGKYVLIK